MTVNEREGIVMKARYDLGNGVTVARADWRVDAGALERPWVVLVDGVVVARRATLAAAGDWARALAGVRSPAAAWHARQLSV